MLHWPRLLGLLLLAALVVPSLADEKAEAPAQKAAKKADDAPKKKAADKEADKDKDKLTWGAELVGKIDVDADSQGHFTLHVTQRILEPDFGAQQQYAQQQMQLAQQQLRMATARTVQDRLQASQQYYQTALQMAQTQQRLFRPRDLNFDVKLRFAEKMKVRFWQPPVEYDDKGNLKKYTAKELQELRGKEGLPGYQAEVDAVRSGQIVKVYLSRKPLPAPAAKNKAAPGKAAKKKTDDEEEAAGPPRPEAVMILVLRDVMPSQ